MADRKEKAVETLDGDGQNEASFGFPTTGSPRHRVDEAALLRKIDLRVCPILFVIYVVAFLDR